MTHIETATASVSYRDRCEDRVAVLHNADRTVVVVADGAGGIGSGDKAAEQVIQEIETAYQRIHSADQWEALLRQIDCRIGSGESTAVVVDIRSYGIAGASVGDSQAWIISDGDIVDLTSGQNRKPLLGSGLATPVAFMHSKLNGLLLVATDGFFDYVKRDAVPPLISQTEFFSIPNRCIEMVRLPSGDLWDDIGVVSARIKPRHRTHKEYSI